MANCVWLVTAKRNTSNVSAGMSVKIVVRKPLQSEVVATLNMKYGVGMVSNGISMTCFDFIKLN